MLDYTLINKNPPQKMLKIKVTYFSIRIQIYYKKLELSFTTFKSWTALIPRGLTATIKFGITEYHLKKLSHISSFHIFLELFSGFQTFLDTLHIYIAYRVSLKRSLNIKNIFVLNLRLIFIEV